MSSPRKYSNPYIEQLITNGKWLIEPEMGKLALGKYLHDLELLNAGAVSLKDLYGKNDGKVEEIEAVQFYNDFTISINEKGELTPTASYWYLDDEDEDKPVDKVIRVISFRGVMMKRGGLSTKAIADVCHELDEAYDTDNVNGVVLEMDTGGGAVQASEMLGDKIKQKNKPVVIAATNIYSGGAWGTAYADHIMGIGKTAGFGSIGVMGEVTDDKEYWENKGYKVHRFYATKSTDKNRPIEEAIQGKYNYYRTTQLDPLCELFISEMASGRQINLEDKSWQTGRTFMTEEAIQIGLCDSQGTLQDAILKCQELTTSKTNKSNHNSTITMTTIEATNATLENQLQQLHTAYMNVLSSNVESGKEVPIAIGMEQQKKANIIMRDEYAKTYAAVKLMDKEMADLKAQVDKLNSELATSNEAKEQLKIQIETSQQSQTTLESEDVVSKEAHDKAIGDLNTELTNVKSERDKYQNDYQTQVQYTDNLIKEHNLNVDTSKNQTDNNQVEETIEKEEKPLTPEQQAYMRIRQTGYKGNVSMGQKVTHKS